MGPAVPPLKELFCDLDLISEGLDCFFTPESSQVDRMKGPVCRVMQVHGRDLLHARQELIDNLSGPRYLQYSYDGMVTADPGPVLTVYSADCLPFLFFDPEKRVIASVHAGWKGTLLGICGLTIEKMASEFQSDPAGIRVVSGPSIHLCCFEIREDVASLFRKENPAWEEWITRSDGKIKLDLHQVSRHQLVQQGVLAEHIELDETCTYCHPDRLPSFRREGGGGRRIISGIRLRDGD